MRRRAAILGTAAGLLAGAVPAQAEVRYSTFRSAALGRDVGYVIQLPPSYTAGSRRYPVLHVLHGLFERPDFWEQRGLPRILKELWRSGEVPEIPAWAVGEFEKTGGFVFDVPVPFTRESWRGRIRACRGVGAGLPAEQVAEFDAAHAELLERTTASEFTVLHRIDCCVLSPVN